MTKHLLLILILFTSSYSFCQTLTAPEAEGVYGGQILDIESWSFDADSVYVAISTESANSIFIAKASRGAQSNDLTFNALSSADADNGFGSEIDNIEIHETTNTLFFLHESKIYQTDVTGTSAVLIRDLVKNFIIVGDTMCMHMNSLLSGGYDTLVWGSIDGAGNFTATNGISLSKNYNDPAQLIIDPSDNSLSIFERGESPARQKIMDPFNAMNNSSALVSVLYPAPIITNVDWRTYGFATDGTWYVVGQPPLGSPTVTDRTIAWSDDNGYTWQDTLMDGPGPAGGAVGNNIIIEDMGAQRYIYCGNLFLKDTINMGAWYNPGTEFISNLNRANDGKTLADPIDNDIKYHTTNIGFGYSTSQGDSIFGWNDGIEAVQVNDIDMNTGYTTGWVASKSGIRKVDNYNTSSEYWNPTYFPNLDGSPYESVVMDPNNDSIVFVGNQRVYRTISAGDSSGLDDGWEEVFTPESSPWAFNRINTKCNVIAVSDSNSDVVLAGFSIDYADKGGVFYSLDGGDTWSQILLVAASNDNDLDVTDIEMTTESGSIVAYIGVESDPMVSGAYGVYRAELSSGVWSVVQDGSFSAKDGVIDLEMNASRDTLIVLYKDPIASPANNVMIKDINNNAWSASIFGPSVAGFATAITIGDGYLFLAMDERIYTTPFNTILNWTLAYSYPVGTEINVLFYDELLVGTGTGLYAQELNGTSTNIESAHSIDFEIYPNPNQRNFRITHQYNIDKVRIMDVQGRIIETYAPQANSVFVNSNLTAGMYIVQIIDDRTNTINKMMVVNN